jgi:hypothetical protein
MKGKSVVLVGNPDSGKSNYVAALWLALKSGNSELRNNTLPEDIKYVESLVEYILKGKFAPRTDQEARNREFTISVSSKTGNHGDIHVPDVSGEMWRNAVSKFEISEKWLQLMSKSSTALLFVRVHSELNKQPLDWVNARELLNAGLQEETNELDLPTQVALIELLRFLEETLINNKSQKAKVAIVVTAWDLLHENEQILGPEKYLERQFPMFFGRISDCTKLELKIFGTSILGGDLHSADFAKDYFDDNKNTSGYIVQISDHKVVKKEDITIPICWLLE